MRAKCLIPIAVAGALLAASAAKAGPNVPLCLALENNFNECMRQQQRQNAWGGGGQGWGGGYGQGDYGRGGYGHGGYDRGWGDGDWDDGYGGYPRPRRQPRGAAKQAECARWLAAIQQNNCAR
jgi:hypothetical protein